MFKLITLVAIVGLVWTNNNARTFIADGLHSAEGFVRPEPKSIEDRFNYVFQ